MMALLCPNYTNYLNYSRQVFADTKILTIYADVKNLKAKELIKYSMWP